MAENGSGKKPVKILTETGKSVIEIATVFKTGEKLCMEGKLMGKFPTTVFLTPGDFFRVLGMVLKPGIILFLLLSPVYWVKERLRASKEEEK